jgi:hypothetical protein
MSQSVSRIRAAIDAMDGSFLLLEPAMDVAIVGLVSGAGRQPVVCYDRDKVVQVLVERDGMERDEAEEFFDVNIEGAYVGPETPMFISLTKSLLAHAAIGA